MKTPAFRRALNMGIFLFPLALTAQEEQLRVYLQPDIDSRLIATTSLEDERLGQPAPVLDEAKAALGWHFADFMDTIEGFIPDAKIGKDLLPVNDTVIRAAATEESPVLGVYRDGDAIEIVETGTWWKIRTRLAFPVYFVLDSPSPLPPVTASAIVEEPVPEEPTPGEPAPLVELPAEEAPAPVIREDPIFDGGEGSMDPVVAPGSTRPTPPEFLGQSYTGIFKQSKRRLGLFKPRAPFFLEGADGRRIAWVDTSSVVIPGSLQSYLNHEVVIHGERDLLENSSDWIIRARNMRRK